MWVNAQCDGHPAKQILRGAPNYRIDLSRYWVKVHHIVGPCGGHIAA